MRYLRAAIVAVVATAALSVPSTALAQIDSVSVSGGTLGPEGASVTVTVNYQCEVGWNVTEIQVDIAQSTGFRLAQGSGSFTNEDPGVACTGTTQTQEVVVHNFSPWAFKQGKATVTSVHLIAFNTDTFDFVFEDFGPFAINISKK
jgi:hypothetical protein